MKRRSKKIGTASPCPVCGGPKGARRVEIVVRAASRGGSRKNPKYQQLASQSITVCGRCADGVFDACAAPLHELATDPEDG